MEHFLTLWPIYAPAVALVGIGLGMIRLEEFKVCRILFWIAAMFLGFTDFIWQLTTPSPPWFRILNGSIAALAVFVIFPMLLQWLRRRQERAGAK